MNSGRAKQTNPETSLAMVIGGFMLFGMGLGFAFGYRYAVPALQVTVKAPSAPAMAYSQEYWSPPVIIGGYSVDTGPNGNMVIVGNCDQKGGK